MNHLKESSGNAESVAIVAGASAFILWGVFPIYWKQLGHLDPFMIVCHRVIWSLITLLVVLSCTTQLKIFRNAIRSRRLWLISLPGSVLIGANWLLFIWAVQNERVIEASLGYFLNPLCNVVLAVCLLGERINWNQRLAVAVAALAVLVIAWTQDGIPWIALSLAGSFSLYSLIKKKTPLPASVGLTLETVLLVPLALGWLCFGPLSDPVKYSGSYKLIDIMWLMSCGPVTTLPLFLFSFAARGTTLITLGMLQYLGPTMQLLIGWLMYHEPMPTSRWLAFALVWLSLLIYTTDLYCRTRKVRRQLALSK